MEKTLADKATEAEAMKREIAEKDKSLGKLNVEYKELKVSRYEINKWKNHFYKMKGDVGMSGHEKERKQEDAYTKIQTHS